MPTNVDQAPENRPHDDDPAVTIHNAEGQPLPLTLNEFRLALLGLVDFEGDWEAMQEATRFVVDGTGKRALIEKRLLPVATALPSLLSRGIDSLEVLAARHWFRHTRL